MLSQLCKICGERHYRYEPHRFATGGKSQGRSAELVIALPSEPIVARRAGSARKKLDESVKIAARAVLVPDRETLKVMDAAAFKAIYNIVHAEHMRRSRLARASKYVPPDKTSHQAQAPTQAGPPSLR